MDEDQVRQLLERLDRIEGRLRVLAERLDPLLQRAEAWARTFGARWGRR